MNPGRLTEIGINISATLLFVALLSFITFCVIEEVGMQTAPTVGQLYVEKKEQNPYDHVVRMPVVVVSTTNGYVAYKFGAVTPNPWWPSMERPYDAYSSVQEFNKVYRKAKP